MSIFLLFYHELVWKVNELAKYSSVTRIKREKESYNSNFLSTENPSYRNDLPNIAVVKYFLGIKSLILKKNGAEYMHTIVATERLKD